MEMVFLSVVLGTQEIAAKRARSPAHDGADRGTSVGYCSKARSNSRAASSTRYSGLLTRRHAGAAKKGNEEHKNN